VAAEQMAILHSLSDGSLTFFCPAVLFLRGRYADGTGKSEGKEP